MYNIQYQVILSEKQYLLHLQIFFFRGGKGLVKWDGFINIHFMSYHKNHTSCLRKLDFNEAPDLQTRRGKHKLES